MQRILDFPHGEVWRIDLRQTPEAASTTALSTDERRRASRFAYKRDGQRYLNAHALLRDLLAQRSGVAPANLCMMAGPHGKPRVPGIEWQFNLSHSGDEALIALSPSREVGVDIEVVDEIEEIEDLAQQYFTPHELDCWTEMEAEKRLGAFYEIWTRKEACVKATGWGLNLPLQRFEAGFADTTPREILLPLPTGGFARMMLMSLVSEPVSKAALAWLLD